MYYEVMPNILQRQFKDPLPSRCGNILGCVAQSYGLPVFGSVVEEEILKDCRRLRHGADPKRNTLILTDSQAAIKALHLLVTLSKLVAQWTFMSSRAWKHRGEYRVE